MLSFSPAKPRDVESLQNWLSGTGSLARKEGAYLTHYRELASLAPAGDSAILQLEDWVEDKLIWSNRHFRMVRENASRYSRLTIRIEPFSRHIDRSKRVYIFRYLN